MTKMFKYLIIIAAVLMLTACAKQDKPAETIAEVTTEATVEETAAETEVETEEVTVEETEAETVGEAIEIGDLHDTHVLSERFDWVQEEANLDGAFQVEPEIGETKQIYYFIGKPDSEGHAKAKQDYFKTVSLPMWGIYKIALSPKLFPDDDSNVHYLTEDEYSWVDVPNGYYDAYIEEFSNDTYEIHNLDKSKSYIWPRFNVTPDNYIYLDENKDVYENGCYDVSEAFPGSLTRISENAIFQTWQQDTDFYPSKDLSMTAKDIFSELYPYRYFDFLMYDDKYYVLEDEDGYTYIYIDLGLPGQFNPIKRDRNDENANYTGSVLFRLKDGKSQGIMYLSAYDPAVRYSNYALNQTLEMMDIDRISEGGTCEDFIQEKE